MALLVGHLQLQEHITTNVQHTMECMEQLQFNNWHIIFSYSRNFFEINRYIEVVNGKIHYFIEGHRVKSNKYYRFRSDFVARKNV